MKNSNFPSFLAPLSYKVVIIKFLTPFSTFCFPPDPRKLIFDQVMMIFRFNFKIFGQNSKMLITHHFSSPVGLGPIPRRRLWPILPFGGVLTSVGALVPELWSFQTFDTFFKHFQISFHLWTLITHLFWNPIVLGPLSFDRSCCVDSNGTIVVSVGCLAAKLWTIMCCCNFSKQKNIQGQPTKSYNAFKHTL